MNSPKTIGRYEIIDELGHGAMGSVFRAQDPSMGRMVAIKTILTDVLASDQGREYRERFYREARAAGALAHPGIVPVFDVGEHEGSPFLVMEFVNGQTLAAAMKKGERATLERVCEIGQQIAEALGYAHRNGVIHRDIKPANILLTSREVYGVERAKITDFGVAKLSGVGMTTTGQLLGTPAFMPPEQFTGAAVDGRADLFSLGVILYQMATGEQPFPGDTMTAVSYKIVHTEPVPPSKLNPAIPARMESVILKCLAKSPADRYQTGEELAQDLNILRSEMRASGMQATLLQPASTSASGAVLDRSASLQTRLSTESAPLPAMRSSVAPVAAPSAVAIPAAATSPKKGALVFAAVAVLAVLALGGGFLLRHQTQITPQQTPTPQVAATTPQAPPPAVNDSTPTVAAAAVVTPPPAGTPVPAPKPSAGATAASKKATLPTTTAKAGAPAPLPIPAPVAAAPEPKSAAVAFNPKSLDPKQNARLRLDLSHLSPGVSFTIQMNGKTYLQGAAGNKADYDNLYLPPGVHELVVVVSSGGVQRTSNTVSAEFIAKKRMTLKVELRPAPKGAAQALDPSAQVIATLKMDRFFF